MTSSNNSAGPSVTIIFRLLRVPLEIALLVYFGDMVRACALPAVYFCKTLQIKHGSHIYPYLVLSMCCHNILKDFTSNIERFRSRISFRDELRNLKNNFKRHVENFLGLKEKAREQGVNSCFAWRSRQEQMTANICNLYSGTVGSGEADTPRK